MDIMGIARSLAVLLALLIGSSHALAQEVTVPGRLQAQASSRVGKHYVQAYTIDARADRPLRSVQLSAKEFEAVLIVVSPDGTADFKDDATGEGSVRLQVAPRTGEWLVVVTSYELLRPGGFSLSVDGPSPSPLPMNRRLPRAAIALLPFERTTAVTSQVRPRVETVTITKVDTVTVMRADTVLVTRVDTVTRIRPAPATRGTAPR
jgi:hypothetical protein